MLALPIHSTVLCYARGLEAAPTNYERFLAPIMLALCKLLKMPIMLKIMRAYSTQAYQWKIYSMLTHEIEARKRLHDHAMEESDRRRSRVQVQSHERTYVCIYALQSSLLSHAARATIRPARYVRMRTLAIALRT